MEVQPSTNNLICQVCGSTGAQIHYRAVACGSCKIFFVRTIQGTSRYLCEKGSTCVVTKDNRNSCKACRFAKCLKANMTEQDVGRFKKNSKCTSKNDAVVPYIAESQWKIQFEKQRAMNTLPPCALTSNTYDLNQMPETISIGAHFVRDLVRTSKAPDYAKTLVYIESLCDNNEAPKSSFAYTLDASLADVLQKPHICCARTPIGWNEELFVEQDNVLDILKQVYCRTVTHFADFVASCPELQLLNSKDKLALCSTNYCGVVLLLMSYNTYLNNCEGILFPHGFKYSLSKKREDNEYNAYLHELVEYLYRNVILAFREVFVTVEEYAIIKALVLFSGVMSLSDEGSEIVSKARRKYGALLSEYVMATRADLTTADQMARVSKLYSIIPHIMHASESDNTYCARMVMMNVGNMNGSLSYDLHVRKF
ncbi:unnamed protein product [Cylicocyclus nassatus]|uniref:Uncharacterized protein n=1 Tax=Cylicocyclus nassatus TaxID=53992 RepID=A0AA36MBF4_CYLNA|nr:unnamed protein product [Cylicocyclus nassatus]